MNRQRRELDKFVRKVYRVIQAARRKMTQKERLKADRAAAKLFKKRGAKEEA